MHFYQCFPEKKILENIHKKHGFWGNYFFSNANAKVPNGTFSWKWLKSLVQRSDLNMVGTTWSPIHV